MGSAATTSPANSASDIVCAFFFCPLPIATRTERGLATWVEEPEREGAGPCHEGEIGNRKHRRKAHVVPNDFPNKPTNATFL
jgi:hypothetical protein